jgi:hypothetical protein
MRMLMLMGPGILLALAAMSSPAEETSTALPDPTRPYAYRQAIDVSNLPSVKPTEWRLYGIQIRGDMKRAIINGRLVKEGDQLGDATVTAISPTEVKLEQDRRTLVLRLLDPGMKHEVAGDGMKKDSEKD